MSGAIFVASQATANAWRHLAAVARTYQRNPTLEADRYARTIQQTATGGDAVKGGRGSEVAMFGASQLIQFEEEHGLFLGAALRLPALAEMVEGDQDVWAALEALARDDWSVFEQKVARFERAGGLPLATLLGALSAIAAVLDPDGTLPTFTLDGTEAPPWSAKPRQVAEWRRQLVARLEAPETAESTAREMTKEHLIAVFPPELFPGLDHVARARLLCEQERDRLRGARMYYAGDDTTAVATRKAARPRKSPLDPQRVPSPSGFLVFEQPVDYAPGMAPLVAASWSVWQPPGHSEDAPTTWSLTLYAHTAATPPLGPVGFERMTAGDVLAKKDRAEENEADFASRAIVACWDLITQERVGKGVVDVAEEKRKPVKVRADRRRGITDDGTVRLVTIRGRQESMPRPRRETDGTGPARRYDRGRWWVHEHTRDHCMNPAAHRDGGCTHQDITVLDYPKGPEDRPFLDTVYVVKPD
ncbi:hypothetical protein [Streptomyces sp. HF10]|uniref:hypothetical protein n=1 Tax=Streptomyces sp. HF10 TaxID=2692233 RepID=UPI00131880CF|nr:hypothetical protein [Streptomyces sp. HF10]QHC33864.1 hypothetical protein GR129_34730 [Streptomyces sp. HF10]